ncbi:butyrate kinase [Anaeroselena agilis]|uniref:Probable butyrate kinase n=1 Tax=Anaeroselena agilis TaxID=3063788 RepID=A0ABU3NW01_9FIRM|nr:butyrate kinase [Selenomonadales bacterium 4137-cl]
MTEKILAINPGSTSTKIAVYADCREILTENLSHSAEELAVFADIMAQAPYRLAKIREILKHNGLSLRDFAAVVGRGGLLKPMLSGTYTVNQAMLDDLKNARYGAHASNLGAILADQLAAEASIPAYIVDPVVVDELDDIARITGRPEIIKKSVFHALNQKATAKRFAQSIGRKYEDLNLVVAHLGGGISVGCHRQGRVVEVNNALDGEGPFTPERAGTVQAGQFVEFVLASKLGKGEVSKLLAGKGGLVACLGTNDAREVEKRIKSGDKEAETVYNAMIYQVARYIAAAAVPVCGKVDHIILTGGIAYSDYLTAKIREYVAFIAPVTVLPGENELQALAEGALRVLSGEEQPREYR